MIYARWDRDFGPLFCLTPENRTGSRMERTGVLIKHPVVTGATMAFRREFFEPMIPIPKDEIHDKWISFLLAAHEGSFEVIRNP